MSDRTTIKIVPRRGQNGAALPRSVVDLAIGGLDATIADSLAAAELAFSTAPEIFAELSTDASEHKFSSTQFNIEDAAYLRSQGSPLAAIKRMTASIPDYALASDGRESKFHITVKYGLLTGDADKVRSVVEGFGPVEITLGKTSIFPAKQTDDQRGGDQYDVVKIDVSGDSLVKLNRLISEELEHEDTHPNYRPHVTLAYVKPGMGKKFSGKDEVDGMKLICTDLVFSDTEKNKTVIDIAGKPSAELSTDAEGHEHKGKGEGGGQFTKVSGSDSEPPATSEPTESNSGVRGSLENQIVGERREIDGKTVDRTKEGYTVWLPSNYGGKKPLDFPNSETASLFLQGDISGLDFHEPEATGKLVPVKYDAKGYKGQDEPWTERKTGGEVLKEPMKAWHYSGGNIKAFRAKETCFFTNFTKKHHHHGTGYVVTIPAGTRVSYYDDEVRFVLTPDTKINRLKGGWNPYSVRKATGNPGEFVGHRNVAGDGANLPHAAELSTDAEGHEHKGKGEGGGQFTGSGGAGGERPSETTPAAKNEKTKFGKSKATVSLPGLGDNAKTQKLLKKMFGKKAPAIEDLSSIVGAPDDAEVQVYPGAGTEGKEAIKVKIRHKYFDAVRYIFKNATGVHVKNDQFWVKEGSQGKGIGADVFGRQVEQCSEMGISSIRCHAAKDNPDNPDRPHNGYYTWPRFGYDQSIHEESGIGKGDEKVYDECRKRFPDAETILDVMSTSEGREWWKKNGTDLMEAKFDLTPQSRSMLTFEKYLQDQESKKSTSAQSKKLPLTQFGKRSTEKTLEPVQLSYDIYDRRAQGILNRAMASASSLSAAVKQQLKAAFNNPNQASRTTSIVDILTRYRQQFSRLLSNTQLAALLQGMREVAKSLPTLPTPSSAGPLPPDLSPEAAKRLIESMQAMPPIDRDAKIAELPASQQQYVRTTLQAGQGQPFTPILRGLDTDDIQYPVIEEAAAQLAEKNIVGYGDYRRMDELTKQKSFAVAGVEQAETLKKVQDALAEQLRTGPDAKDFGDKVMQDVEAGTFLSEAHRELIFRNNIQRALSDGQITVLRHPVVRSGFPYAAREHIPDDRVRRTHAQIDQHGLDGTNVFMIDDPSFEKWRPPNEPERTGSGSTIAHNCRCGWTAKSVQDAANAGVSHAKRWLETGEQPASEYVKLPEYLEHPQLSLVNAPLSIQLSLEMSVELAWGFYGGPRGGKGWKNTDPKGTEDIPDVDASEIEAVEMALTETIELAISVWQPYEGPRGGRGFKNSSTGKVVYGSKAPGSGPKRGTPESKASARKHLEDFKSMKPTAENINDTIGHLSNLTVAELRQFAKSNNLKAPAKIKADLVKKIAEKLAEQAQHEEKPAAKTFKPKAGKKMSPENPLSKHDAEELPKDGFSAHHVVGKENDNTYGKGTEKHKHLLAGQIPDAAKMAKGWDSLWSAVKQLGNGDGLENTQQLQADLQRTVGIDLPAEKFKGLIVHLWKQGLIEMKVLNEVRNLEKYPKWKATVPFINGNAYAYAMKGRNATGEALAKETSKWLEKNQ